MTRGRLRFGLKVAQITCPAPYSARGACWAWDEVVTPLRG